MTALFTTRLSGHTCMRRILNVRHRFYPSVKLFSNEETNEIESFLTDYTDLEFRPLHLKSCIFGESFTNARIDHDEFYFTDSSTGKEIVPTIELKTLFHHGVEKLETIVRGEFNICLKNKENQDFCSSVLALLSFIRNIRNHEMALKDKYEGSTVLDDKECSVAALLTNHLLSPLVPGPDYIIDNQYQDKPTYCPCWSRSCRRTINYGRTSLGNSKMWYGYPDVVVFPNTVMVEQDFEQEEEEKEDVYNLQNEKRAFERCELETNQNLNILRKKERIASEIISQTITASLYTSALRIRKPELGIPDISLIPSLLLTSSTYCIYMYDSKHDILLTSGPNPTYLWNNSGVGYRFNKSAIMHIWMALNHFQLLPSIDPAHIELIQQSSNFQKLCETNGFELAKIASQIQFQSKFVKPEKFGHKNSNTKQLESSRNKTQHTNSTNKWG
ncbi:uncharacterized protein LOC134708438 isoform X2 [Mytilus trossulus]|uniref:uncharacterized protein LOC134708438 isoform X2 n=2 Tax=Mytilus trossulus TaxID=6551 RepID=UPI003003E1F9